MKKSYTKEYKRKKAKEWRDKNPDRHRQLVKESQERHPESVNNWQRNNPEKARSARRKTYHKSKVRLTEKRYGLQEGEWHIMFEKQHGCCAICGKHQSELKTALHVDHNHETREVRGLLCNVCNMNLGVLHKWYVKYRLEIENYCSLKSK